MRIDKDSDIITPAEESDVPEDEEQSLLEDVPAEDMEWDDWEWEARNTWRLMHEIDCQTMDEMT